MITAKLPEQLPRPVSLTRLPTNSERIDNMLPRLILFGLLSIGVASCAQIQNGTESRDLRVPGLEYVQGWRYVVNAKPNDHETMCRNPLDQLVGPWRSCRIDVNCHQPVEISRRCAMRHGSYNAWHYAVNPSNDFETRCIRPNGDFVGGFRDCRTQGTCNSAAAIIDRCRIDFGG